MAFEERKNILINIECVDEVIGFEDDNEGSCIHALNKIKEKYPNDELIFCNGGDRDKNNIPEMAVKNISFKFGVGGSEKKTLLHGFLKIGSMKAKKEFGAYSITCLTLMM